jgi:ABC-2 type transport system ATP-binding protein
MTPVLEARDLRRSFGAGRGLSGVDLTVGAGEIVGLLGPNGAGKTSLVRALTGRLRLEAGRVSLLGRDPRTDPGSRRALGLVPQEIALYPDLTVAENLQLLGELAGLPRRDALAAVPAALAWIDLAGRATSRIATLSGGQKRRVNLAVATLHRPAALILDEPTVGVDLPARDRIHALLRDLRSRGAAILLATHDLDQAAQLSDRIGIMVEGRVRAEGTPAELIGRWFPAGSRELSVTLGDRPDEAARAALRARGLEAGADPLAWTGAVAGIGEVAALLGGLEAAGVAIRDTRIREPGLSGVFLKVTGRELAE